MVPALTTSTELRIPTQTFLLPGQEFCIGLPWERGELPVHGRSVVEKTSPARLTLRGDGAKSDPFEGFELGACTVLRKLSDGAARTLLAIRRDDERPVNLGVLRKLELPEVLARDVRNHAEWAGRFTHSALVQVFPCEVGEEGVFWVTGLASGATLFELAAAMKKTGQGVPMGLVLGAALDVAKGLAELHGVGAAHGLVTSQSIAVGFDGNAQLHDTGLFRCMGQGDSWMELREAMASNFAPEQLLGGRLPDAKTDVFALGAVLYEALTGEKVRRAKTVDQHVALAKEGTFVPPSKFNMLVDASLDEVIARALSADRAKRYATGREFAQALSAAVSTFTWKKELRAQFVARHFEPRKKEEESLREQVARLPPPSPRRPSTLESVALPMTVIPSSVMVPRVDVHALAAPVPAPKPSVPGRKKKKRGAAPVKRWPTALAFVASLLVVAGATYGLKPAPLPKPPPMPLVWLDDVSTGAERIEFTSAATCLDECSREPELLVLPERPPEVVKVARVTKKKRVPRGEEVPMPPWLVSKKRR